MFDDRLKKLRELKGYSMRQMAEALGMRYTTYVNYEKNEREPNSESLILIAKYFDVSIDYLLGLNNAKSENNCTTMYLQKEIDTLNGLEEIYGKDIKDLVCRAAELNEQGINKLYEYCRDLLEVPKYLKSRHE